jgi:hypothetical protein
MDPNVSPAFVDPNLASLLPYLAYLACGVLIILYAWDRFSTPASNRSSTRQALYRWGCAGYVVSALGLFVVLSVLLQVGAWRTMLLGPESDKLSLPAPLIATLMMTTLLSSVPLLKQVDGWFLSAFLDWASIPAEVKRRAATMTPQSFGVTERDVTALRDAYGDGSYGDTLADHLCARCNDGMESQYRLTKVVKLYDQIRQLTGNSDYSRFFAETADGFAALERKVATFLRRSDSSLTFAKRLRAMDAKDARAIEDFIQDRRNTFAEDSRDLFGDLALFLARAVLRSEPSEEHIVGRLINIGFSASVPMNVPRFPIDSLTVLAVLMFVYFVIVLRLPIVPNQPGGGLSLACKITIARLASIGLTVWLMQKNYSVFHRLPGGPPRYFGYALCGVIAAAASAGVCLIFRLGDVGGLVRADLPVIVISGVLCAALSFCCDDWAGDTAVAPIWLRFREAVGCGSVMAVGMALMYFATDLLPKEMSPWALGLAPLLGLLIGGWVPHIYRSAQRAAMSERGNASGLPVSQAIAQARVTQQQLDGARVVTPIAADRRQAA